jgi:hypothetical protein
MALMKHSLMSQSVARAYQGTYSRWKDILIRAVVVIAVMVIPAFSTPGTPYRDPTFLELGAIGAEAINRVDSVRYHRIVRDLCAPVTREIGTRGNRTTIEYIENVFDSLGLTSIKRQRFSVPIARQYYARAILSSANGALDTVNLYSYSPNFARTNTIRPGGLRGHLVYTRTGHAREYNGTKMDGSILLAEMTVGNRWRLAAGLGTRAAIFIESELRNTLVGANYFTSINFPRFFAKRKDGAFLKAWTKANPNRSITLEAFQPWEQTWGDNVVGFLKGTDPVLSREVVVLTAPMDASSVVRGLAPGAEASISAATLLELAHIFKAHPPKRSMLFVALNGQTSSILAGGRQFVLALNQNYPKALLRDIEFLRKDARLISDRNLASGFPAYRRRALALEDSLDAIISGPLDAAEDMWSDLKRAHKDYHLKASPEIGRRNADLVHARQQYSDRIVMNAEKFAPVFERACDAMIPVIHRFGMLHHEFVDSLLSDKARLQPIIDVDKDKIRTTIRARLAAARLSDVKKALRKVNRISSDDHTRRLSRLRFQYHLVQPVLTNNLALLVDLDITSGSRSIGVFHKGHLYSQLPDIDLQRQYMDLGKRLAKYAENMVIVNDIKRLRRLSEKGDSLGSLIRNKITAITAHKKLYEDISGMATTGIEETYKYTWYQRAFNKTGVILSILTVLVCGAILIYLRLAEKQGPVKILFAMVVVGLVIGGYGLDSRLDWKNTYRMYHGIDSLMWNPVYVQRLVDAESIPREDKTKIRLAHEKQISYVDLVEAPQFFADNVISAIPAKIEKLSTDSVNMANQLVVLDRMVEYARQDPTRLTEGIRDSLRTFIEFLGLSRDRRFVDCISGTKTKQWYNFLPGNHVFTSEIATLSGLPAVALSTVDDAVMHKGTPGDRLKFITFSNVMKQASTITGLLTQALTDPLLPDDMDLATVCAEVHGTVLYDDRQASVTADVPVDSAVLIADRKWGRRFYAMSDRRGSFSIYGLPVDGRGYPGNGKFWFHAYKTDRDSGHIKFAIDLGNEQHKFEPRVSQLSQNWSTIVFPCVSISITDVLDQRYFQHLITAEIFDARTDATPPHYFTHVQYGDNSAFVEPGKRVKMIFKQGLLGIRSMLTGVPDTIRMVEHRQGLGFPVPAETLLVHTAYQGARDMWELNDARLKTLIRHGIIDEETKRVHDRAATHLRSSKSALHGISNPAIRRILEDAVRALEAGQQKKGDDYVQQAIVAMNATDPDGFRAALKRIHAASSVLSGPAFTDIRGLLTRAKDAIDRHARRSALADITTANARLASGSQVRPLLLAVESALEDSHYVAAHAHLLNALDLVSGNRTEAAIMYIEGVLNGLQYDIYLTEAKAAAALESRVLPDILGTASGALKGVLFYMALLLPFAFFLERLIIGSTDVRRQAIMFFLLFLFMFVIIEQVHPAFDITTAPPMVLLAFTVFALSMFVMFIIISKFSAQMQQIRKERQGYLSADVGRMSAMLTAFMLGVSNMRKRKMRTALTCLTLTLLTFTVLSFTSVKQYMRVNEITLSDKKPAYGGVLIRDRYWMPWPTSMLPSMLNDLGRENIVVGRAWREIFRGGKYYYFTLTSEAGKKYTLTGFVGMEAAEDEVTGIFRKAGVAGRWLRDGDQNVMVIPETAAVALGISRADVTGDAETAPKVMFEGRFWSIVGILGDERLRQIVDLDGEQLTSVNWMLSSTERVTREQQLMSSGQQELGQRDTFIHQVPAQCMFMPLHRVWGGLVSIAIKTPSPEATTALVETSIKKWAIEMYVGKPEGTSLYSTVGLASLGGMKDVMIPIVIAALIVLNTMLGAVYERTREIGIFTAVGLAPSHVSMLFMAEALVYAVLGAMGGYLLGQSVGQLVYKTGVLKGMTLNYSSLSAIASSVIVMVTVILSTIYPSRKASQISVPDIARNWKLPEPNGDEWYFALPFTIMGEELEGLNAFLSSFLDAHKEESSSDFYIDKVDFWVEGGKFMLETMAWLAPYDLGVSQLVTIITKPAPDEVNLYEMSMLVTRESGDTSSWNRVNRRFVNFLRKQLLIWRTLTPDERMVFVERGRKMFRIDGQRAIESELRPVELS